MRPLISLCFFLILSTTSAQYQEQDKISMNIIGCENGYYMLADTIQMSLRVPAKNIDETEVNVDLISPFEEVMILRKVVLHKGKALVHIPILPLWEAGFYQIRVYTKDASKILATQTIPILARNAKKEIPLWHHIKNEGKNSESWRDFSASGRSFIKGALLTKKLKPLHKEGIRITIKEVSENKANGEEWSSESRKDGTFIIEIPKNVRKDSLIYTQSFKGKDVSHPILLFPDDLPPSLSKEYESDIKKITQRLDLHLEKNDEEERSYYIYDMRREALNFYLQGKKFRFSEIGLSVKSSSHKR